MTFELPHTKPIFKHQDDATINQANPVSGTKYEVLAETKNVRIISIAVRCTWTVQPTPLEVWITVDGQTMRFYFPDPISDTWYKGYIADESVEGYLTVDYAAQYRAFLLEGRSVKVEAEITGGTVSNLSARVKWAKME